MNVLKTSSKEKAVFLFHDKHFASRESQLDNFLVSTYTMRRFKKYNPQFALIIG